MPCPTSGFCRKRGHDRRGRLMRRQPQSTPPRRVRSMELTHGRLKAALIAGKIPVTDEALAILRAGLSTIGRGYHIAKVISGMAKTDTELKKELSRLHVACRTVVDVLDADLSGLSQIGAMLSDPWRGSQVPRLVEELRLL